MSESLTASLALVAICLSTVSLGLISVLAGKVFFSTHVREFLPVDHFAKIKKDLAVAAGISKELDEEEQEKEERRMNELSKRLWNGFSADEPLSELEVAKPRKREQ